MDDRAVRPLDQVWSAAELEHAGWPRGQVRGAVRSGRLRRLTHGVYGHTDELEVRIAAHQLRWPAAIASHQTAALLLGFGDPLATAPLHLTLHHSSTARPGPGLVLHRTTRAVMVTRLRGLLVTTPVQTVLDLARCTGFVDGVIRADAALAAGAVRLPALHRSAADLHRLPGARRARRVLDAARVGAQSPQESRLRLLLAPHLPAPVLQHPVPTALGTLHLDLAWPSVRVAVEYDGRLPHGDPQAFTRDRRRWRALHAAGWDVHPVTAADLHALPRLVADLGRALRGGASLGGLR